MKPEAQLIALLEWLEWRDFEEFQGKLYAVNLAKSTGDKLLVPPLTLDLMHEVEKRLSEEQAQQYLAHIERTMLEENLDCPASSYYYHATKEQRLEAMIRTLNLWKEDK